MNQKCQRKKQEKDALLANAVDNEPASTEVAPKVPTETSAAPTAPLLEPAVESSTAPAEPAEPAEPAAPTEPATVSVESAPAVESSTAPAVESSTAPADSTSVAIPAPEEPKKLVSLRYSLTISCRCARSSF